MSRSVKVQKTAKKINWRRVREEELEERMDEEMREMDVVELTQSQSMPVDKTKTN